MRRRRCGSKRAATDTLHREQRRSLLQGRGFFGDEWGRGTDDEQMAARRAAWRKFKAALLREWIAERPGTRPAAWWLFDAPEPREEHESEAAFLERLDLLTADERH